MHDAASCLPSPFCLLPSCPTGSSSPINMGFIPYHITIPYNHTNNILPCYALNPTPTPPPVAPLLSSTLSFNLTQTCAPSSRNEAFLLGRLLIGSPFRSSWVDPLHGPHCRCHSTLFSLWSVSRAQASGMHSPMTGNVNDGSAQKGCIS